MEISYPYSKSLHSSSNILYHPIHIIFDRMIQNITLNIQYILDDGSSFNWFNYSSYWYPYCINTLNLSLSIKISHPVTDPMCVDCSGYTIIFDIQQSTTSNHCKWSNTLINPLTYPLSVMNTICIQLKSQPNKYPCSFVIIEQHMDLFRKFNHPNEMAWREVAKKYIATPHSYP